MRHIRLIYYETHYNQETLNTFARDTRRVGLLVCMAKIKGKQKSNQSFVPDALVAIDPRQLSS